MRILFHGDTLNYRGTTVALTDYAKYNQEILGNESIITYCKSHGTTKDFGSVDTVINDISKNFKVVGYDTGELEKVVDDVKADVTYLIRAGNKDYLPTNCKTAVHSVFQFYEPHGDSYAYISKWLSEEMSQGQVPHVPHIVKLPEPITSYRKSLGIRDDQIVVGRLGGYYTFDIPQVKEYVKRLVSNDKTNTFVFLFVGTEPFIDHPNVKFINEIHDIQKKSNFISTCDCMLHARLRGESFGLSIAEFLYHNKPVIAWNGGHDKNHLEMLKDSGTLYNNEDDLNYILHNLKDFNHDWSSRVKEYSPETVMSKFNEIFINGTLSI